jgi:hypothetical protein
MNWIGLLFERKLGMNKFLPFGNKLKKLSKFLIFVIFSDFTKIKKFFNFFRIQKTSNFEEKAPEFKISVKNTMKLKIPKKCPKPKKLVLFCLSVFSTYSIYLELTPFT